MAEKKASPKEVKAQEWKDISNEEYRKYTVVTQMGAGEVKINSPKGLKEVKVDLGNGQYRTDHVVLDETGEQHMIEAGWVKISFKLKA